MTSYSGCGVCMKVCPIQRYGMPQVMSHYIETAEVLGKGTENLEGYTLEDKGYFKTGQLPKFEPGFFDMPMGRSEDLVMDEYRERIQDVNGDANAKEVVWMEFREKLDKALERRNIPVDMGMDLGG